MAVVKLPFKLPLGEVIVERRQSIGQYEHTISEMFLKIGDVKLPLKSEDARAIVMAHLPEEDLVWTVNEDNRWGCDKGEPEWCVVPYPEGWILGNTHYRTKADAQCTLLKRLADRIEKYKVEHVNEVNRLERIIHSILGTADIK